MVEGTLVPTEVYTELINYKEKYLELINTEDKWADVAAQQAVVIQIAATGLKKIMEADCDHRGWAEETLNDMYDRYGDIPGLE